MEKETIEIRQVTENKKAYLELLLLADEQESMIDRYLDRGTMYVLEDDGVKAECVVTDEGNGILEIKNLAVVPDCHRQGYGRHMIRFLEETYRSRCGILKVGTGDSPLTVPFYEACGYMISAQGQKTMQERLIGELMALPNTAWDAIIQSAHQDPNILQDSETIKVVGNIMKTNVSACSSIGSYFYPQIGKIYLDMLTMYRASSQLIDEAVQRDGMFKRD